MEERARLTIGPGQMFIMERDSGGNAFKKNLGERIDSSYEQELRGIKEDVSFELEVVVGVLKTGGIDIPLGLDLASISPSLPHLWT